MAKGVTVGGRFPVPLRSTVKAEANMLEELEALKGTYGGINERLREWLVRGLKELEQRTQQAPSAAGDATSALVAVARELSNSVAVSQHFLAMYTLARKNLLAAEQKARSQTASNVGTPPVEAEPSPAASATVAQTQATAPSEAAAEEARSPRVNWDHLKNLVGG